LFTVFISIHIIRGTWIRLKMIEQIELYEMISYVILCVKQPSSVSSSTTYRIVCLHLWISTILSISSLINIIPSPWIISICWSLT
jgi:hypothetical protein